MAGRRTRARARRRLGSWWRRLPGVNPRATAICVLVGGGLAGAALAGCQAGTGFLDSSLDRSCVPEFPGDVFEFDDSAPGADDLACMPEVDPEPAPEGEERVQAHCFTKVDDTAVCPSADDALVLDALEASLIYDCGPCALDSHRVGCEVDSGGDDDRCCYRYFVTESTCSTSG